MVKKFSTYSGSSTIPQLAESEIRRILGSKSHYSVLDLQPTASCDDVRKSYLQKSKLVHPDKTTHTDAKEAFHSMDYRLKL